MLTADSLITADSLLTADGYSLLGEVTGVVSLPENYRAQLAALLPTGLAWPREPDAMLQKLLTAWASELALVDARANELIVEANPTESQALLTDWARVTDVPDVCMGGESTVESIRAFALTKLASVALPTPAYFVELAASIGYAVTVTEFRVTSVEDDVDAPILTEAWAYVFQVNTILNGGLSQLTVDDNVDTSIESWSNNTALECVINRAKPAHTKALFSYT